MSRSLGLTTCHGRRQSTHLRPHGFNAQKNALSFPQEQGKELTGTTGFGRAEELRREGEPSKRMTTINQCAISTFSLKDASQTVLEVPIP
jgi:hypothetical protein